MLIRQRAILYFFILTVLSIIAIHAIVRPIIFNNILATERESISNSMSLAVNALVFDTESLQKFSTDWAQWDDTYDFVSGRHQEQFLESNLTSNTFSAQNLDFIIILRKTGDVLYQGWFNHETDEFYQPPSIIPHELIVAILAAKEARGIVVLQGAPALVSLQPITDSHNVRHSNALLLVGRYLDDSEIRQLSDFLQLSLDLKVLPPDAALPDSDFTAFSYQLRPHKLLPQISSSPDQITASTYLTDIARQRIFLYSVTEPRHYYEQGIQMITSSLWMVVLIAVFFSLITFHLIDRRILTPISQLSQQLDTIGSMEDIPIQPQQGETDEIGQLKSHLFDLLHQLKASHLRLKDSHSILEQISIYDGLTGVYNRSYFESCTEDYPPDLLAQTGILVCDLDGLKLANDMFGHASGDQLLCAMANLLLNQAPPGAKVFRMGGDEFAMLVKQTDETTMNQHARNVLTAMMQTTVSAEGTDLPLSASFGIAVNNPADILPLDELMKKADSQLYREKLLHTQNRQSSIVQTLKETLSIRDHRAEGHGEAMADRALLMADLLQLSRQQTHDLLLLVEFHDVGKIGIPDYILFKPGPLTDDEWTEMKKHCEIGYRIARSTPELSMIAELILKHHEWWNGTGYPIGLSGDNIPLECRIMNILDAYDAMCHDRPYRPAMSPKEAGQELLARKGTQFDPDLLDVFLRILDSTPPNHS